MCTAPTTVTDLETRGIVLSFDTSVVVVGLNINYASRTLDLSSLKTITLAVATAHNT